MATEEWLPIAGYEGKYEVSSFGRVRSLDRYIHLGNGVGTDRFFPGQILKLVPTSRGYLCCSLSGRRFEVHRLVALAFLGRCPPEASQVAHNDGTRTNNRVDNLRWSTALENQRDRKTHGTCNRGERNPKAKLSESEVIAIRANTTDSHHDLAADHGVSVSTIGRIRRCKSWQHLAD